MILMTMAMMIEEGGEVIFLVTVKTLGSDNSQEITPKKKQASANIRHGS